MPNATVEITNEKGLHARASAKFVAVVAKLPPEMSVFIAKTGVADSEVSARDIMSLLMLGAAKGDSVTITVDGDDSEAALNKLVGLVVDGFGET